MKTVKKFLALFLAVAMILVSVPYMPAVAESAVASVTRQMNNNQGDGIILYKDAVPHLNNGVPDGTIDIIIEAMTTGAVTSSMKVVPTDIVLVLDVSGSMDEADSHTTITYSEVYAELVSSWRDTYYGFDGYGSYYILIDGEYIQVSRANADDNDYYYYRYSRGGSWVYVYPELDASEPENRSENYPVYQFYTRRVQTTTDENTKMDHLQSAVKNFIEQTYQSNEGISNSKDKHRISIIKFADDSYYNGSGATQDVTDTAVGNNFNSSRYNYTQIVSSLTVVDKTGADSLKGAVDSLVPAGATAIDYGLALAEHALFDDRTEADIKGRHEIVVVFTDGSPTHSNGYSSSVAAAAVNNAARLKAENVEIYTISVDSNADSTQLGTDQTNIFCHYVSSNYPDATASGNTINPGSGNPSAGYYWVPDDVLTLDAIFESVFEAVGAPKIVLGESAEVIDTLTPYFVLPDGAGDITLQTVAKTATGWADPVTDSSLAADVNGKQIKVNGFDFDSNYISSTPRENDFYGKMLRIVINVTPDYTALDARSAEIAADGGYVETNLGNAAVLDSTQTPVAVVGSPGITFNSVTYLLDGAVYKKAFRLPAAEDTVLPKIANNDVRTYTEWSTDDVVVTNGSYIMPNADVVFSATSTKINYTVSYQYKGTVPAGAPELPATETHTADDVVTVAGAPSLTGYVFSGWQAAEVLPSNGEFSMPTRNVVFVGSFAPSNTVAYKVEHYLQGTDGEFPSEPSDSHYHYDGTTGETVNAIIMGYPQFEYVDSFITPSGQTYTSVSSGTVLADGSLVLKLYFVRETHTLTYKYDGTVPQGAPLLPETETYLAGKIVTLAQAPALEGYTFVGWASDGADVIITDGKIMIPDRDVVIHGFFLENGDTEYKVAHYLESDVDGVYENDPVEVTEHNGQTNAFVVGEPLSYEGYSYNSEYSAATAQGNILPDGSLVLKLYYNKTPYTVTYKFTGEAPIGGFPALPETLTYHMDDVVDVADIPSIPGYTFHGWITGSVAVSDGQFVMPDQSVVFTGYFERDEAPYTINHYFQNENGEWTTPNISYPVDSHVGEQVSAEYITVDGYEKYSEHADTKTSGTVASDGSLVLKLFYKRTSYTVTYTYDGYVPSGASQLPVEVSYIHGANVTVEPLATAPGYTFSGWSSETVTVDGNQFTMPNANVVFVGRFTANTDTPYKVEHYKQNLDGTYNDAPDDIDNCTGTTGTTVEAAYRSYEGFTPASDNILTGVVTAGTSTLVIKLYYTRNTYNVYYRYLGAQPEGAPDISGYNLTNVPYGTDITLADKPELEDHDFFGWISYEVSISGTSFTMPNRDVIILGNFIEKEKFSVSYQYTGNVPENAPALPGSVSYLPGATVTVADAPVLDGYVFSGWTSEQITVSGTSFDMPEEHIVFTGEFVPVAGTVTVNKRVLAPSGFTVTAPYQFIINGIDDANIGFIDIFYVTPGTPTTLTLAPGTYRITEIGGDMDGFDHSVFSNVRDGVITVTAGEELDVTFTNTYSAVLLEKDDHFAYIIGYPDGTVRPESNITRAEVATIFFRMLKDDSRNEYWSTVNTFSDVSESDWFNTAISTLQNAGVLTGYEDGTFRPNEYITRAELVKIVSAFYGADAGSECHFQDVSDHWARRFIETLFQLGIVDGYTDGSFKPDQNITRAEAMKLINRTLDRVPDKDHLHEDMITWSDNSDESKWYYAEVQEATNSHSYVREEEHEVWRGILPVRDWATLESSWKEEH